MEIPQSDSSIQQIFIDYQLHIRNNTKFRNIIVNKKDMGISDHLTCLMRNLYAGQETIVRTRHGIMDWFQIGKGVLSRLYIVTMLI